MYGPTVPTLTARTYDGRSVQVPDFSSIVALAAHPHLDGCAGCLARAGATPWWTPRNADLLHAAAEQTVTALNDMLTAAGSGRGLDWQVAILPYVVTAWADLPWAHQFAGCFAALVERIAGGQIPVPACTGDQVVLNLVLFEAGQQIDEWGTTGDAQDGLLHVFAEVEAALPHSRLGYDYDIDLLREVLLGSPGVLELYNMGPGALEAGLAGAVGGRSLHPANWFTPFAAGATAAPASH